MVQCHTEEHSKASQTVTLCIVIGHLFIDTCRADEDSGNRVERSMTHGLGRMYGTTQLSCTICEIQLDHSLHLICTPDFYYVD